MPDAFGFSDADDDDFSVLGEGVYEGLNGVGKCAVESFGESFQLGGFNGEDGACFFDQIHGGSLPEGMRWVNPSKSGDLGEAVYSLGHR